MRTNYDEIYNSIVNGQFRQFVEQFEELDNTGKAEFMNYIVYELDQPDLLVRAMQAYFHIKAR